MVRFATVVVSVVMLSACSSSEGTPAVAAPEKTLVATSEAAPPPPVETVAENPSTAAPPAAAAPAPAVESSSALSFRSIDGRNIAIENYKGKPVAVMFFSTDCPHCQSTAEILAPIYQEYRQKGVEILGIAVNPTAQTNLPAFAARYRVDFPVGLGNSVQWATFAKFSITKRAYVPHILFVGKDGQIAEDHPGEDQAFWQDQATSIPASFDRLLAE
jgi:thiol-disulfide isomerase/thioredoxin